MLLILKEDDDITELSIVSPLSARYITAHCMMLAWPAKVLDPLLPVEAPSLPQPAVDPVNSNSVNNTWYSNRPICSTSFFV